MHEKCVGVQKPAARTGRIKKCVGSDRGRQAGDM
jgi:hypothetical protein